MSSLSLDHLFAVLLLCALLLPRRRLAGAGAALAGYAVGAGAFAAVPGITGVVPLADRLATIGFSAAFVGINVGLMLLAAGTVVIGGLATAAEEGAALRMRGGGAVIGGIVVLAALLPLLRVAGLPAAAAAVAILAAAAALARGGGAAERRLAERRRRAGVEPPAPADLAAARRPALAAAAAVLIALAAPHAVAVIAAAVLAAVAGHIAMRRAGRGTRLPVLPIVATVTLLPFGWLLGTIAGPVGLAIVTLPLVPLSVAAQALLVPLLAAGAWGFLGAAPLHRLVPGAILAPVAGALLLRIGAPALGAGFEHLQPALFTAGAVAAWHAAMARRAATFVAVLAFVATAGIFTGAHVSPAARVAAAVLFPAAALTAALGATLAGGRSLVTPAARPLIGGVARVLVLVTGLAGHAAIAAGLRAEVVLTVAVAAAAAALAWRLR